MHFESSSYNLSKSLMCAQRSQKLRCGDVGKIEQDDILAMMVSFSYGVEQNPTNAKRGVD
jgi:hypothetical protein